MTKGEIFEVCVYTAFTYVNWCLALLITKFKIQQRRMNKIVVFNNMGLEWLSISLRTQNEFVQFQVYLGSNSNKSDVR